MDIMQYVTNKGQIILFSEVDKPLVEGHTWCIDGAGYALTTHQGKTARLHNLIMPKVEGKIIDHKNRNKLDNTRGNLRYCTHAENLRNITNSRPGKYIGVEKLPYGRFRGAYSVNRKRVYTKICDTAEQAAKLRDEAVKIYYGEFASLNGVLV